MDRVPAALRHVDRRGFYLIGYKAAYDRMENTVPSTVEVSVAWQKVSPCGS
ncbi:MAG: hypothetical protein ACLTYN_10690 [Dysosmobacter welbionis]